MLAAKIEKKKERHLQKSWIRWEFVIQNIMELAIQTDKKQYVSNKLIAFQVVSRLSLLNIC